MHMSRLKRFPLDRRYMDVNLTRTLVIYSLLVPYCAYLCIDNFTHGNRMIGTLALFCAIMTGVATAFLSICRFGKKPHRILMHIAIIIQCFVYWFTFGVFLYTGGTGGTSIFLIFAAAPVCFFFFNLFYGSIFCVVLLIGMFIYMQTPLHLLGYRFPDMYYDRLPMMYLAEIIMCAVAQYEADRFRIKQDAALEEARRASEAKTEFLANTSHEIRTPINAVLGLNEMILREIDKSEAVPDPDSKALLGSLGRIKNYAGNVDNAGNNLLSIINDILDVSKIEEGKMEIVETDYQLSSVLSDLSGMIYPRSLEKDLEFITDIDATIPDRLHGDEVKVRQIITNLLTNAVKYTDEGSITLAVHASEPVGNMDGDKIIDLIITVSDTGIGIRQEDIGKLFTKFERIDLTRNSTIEGTGLGLAITRALLKMMHGSIKVASQYGKGSTFTVRLPQKILSDEPIGNLKAGFERQTEQRLAYRAAFTADDARILIVDDTKMNLLVVTEFLKETHMRTDTATSGAEAIQAAAVNAYDIILMDQRMPGMDGIETMKHIKDDPDGPNRLTPVICLTADAVLGARERYLAKGFTDYLSKPIDSASLEAMLLKYLPQEKITLIDDPAGDVTAYENNSMDGRLDILSKSGVDIAKGIRNCGGDESFYMTILAEYAQSSPGKIRELEKHLEAEDMNSYGIIIHSVKSSSRTIGAMQLGDDAYELEIAAKNGDLEAVRHGHYKTMYDLTSLVDTILPVVSSGGSLEGSGAFEDADGDILEFDPV